MRIEEEKVYLTEEEITAITDAVQEHLDSIGLDDIEIDEYEESGTYYAEEDELDLSKIGEGLSCYLDWHCDWWFRSWTEYWTDPYCTPSFSEGDIDWMWLDKVGLYHDEYEEFANQEEIEKRIFDAIYGKQKEVWDKYIERRKAIRAKKEAERKARLEQYRKAHAK